MPQSAVLFKKWMVLSGQTARASANFEFIIVINKKNTAASVAAGFLNDYSVIVSKSLAQGWNI